MGLWPRLRDGEVIDHRRRIPVGIQVVVSSLEWSLNRVEPVQVSNQVLRIGSESGIKFRNGDVSDLQLLPGLFFVRLEYFIERLNRGIVVSQTLPPACRNSPSWTLPCRPRR